jgi:hypothetical protein
MQADFGGDSVRDLVLPLVVYQIKTAISDLHNVYKKQGLVRLHGGSLEPLLPNTVLYT